MVSVSESDLLENAKSRFKEAKVLHENQLYEGAFYLCGYALEFMLKRHISRKLNWSSFPPSGLGQADRLFKIHELDQLLLISGLEAEINAKDDLLADWKKASQWKAEMRYTKVGQITEQQSLQTIEAFKSLLNFVSKSS